MTTPAISFSDNKFLPSGTYAIINAAYDRYIALNEEGESLSTSCKEYRWSISFLENKKWTIQGASHAFIDLPPYPEEGEDVLAAKNPPKPHQWFIKHRGAQNYIIYSPSQPQLLWCLPNSNEGTTLQLSVDHGNSSLWKFKKIQTLASVVSCPSSYLYYRIYNKENSIPTTRPAYVNDPFVGCISSEWIPPPRSIYSLRVFLSTLENINPRATRLFANSFSNIPLDGNRSIPVLGFKANTPLILVSDVLPKDGMEPGTEYLLVPPELRLTPRFLYYSIFTANGPFASKAPVNADEPWVSTIDLDTLPPLLSVASLKQRIGMKEEISGLPHLFTNKNDMHPFNNDYFQTEYSYGVYGQWPGSAVEVPVLLEFPVRRPFEIVDSAIYSIRSCLKNRPLNMSSDHKVGSRYSGSQMYATFKLQEDGGFAIGTKHHKGWLGPDLSFQDTEHSFHFIRSKEDMDWFFICQDSTLCRALYYMPDIYSYDVSWKDFNASDRNYLWHLEVAE